MSRELTEMLKIARTQHVLQKKICYDESAYNDCPQYQKLLTDEPNIEKIGEECPFWVGCKTIETLSFLQNQY